MEQINPYAVMRNTATYEAYRARLRAIARAGQPFSIIAFTLMMVWFSSFEIWIVRRAIILGVIGVGGAIAAAVFGGIAILRMNRYRREHPIPEEWRQIPRVSWPLVPGRKPPLP